MTLSETEQSAGNQPKSNNLDVIVVGASLAGCTAARLYAQQGLRVALVEQQREAGAFKQLCTHFIQASATPVLKAIGLDQLIERPEEFATASNLGGGQGQADGASPAHVRCAVEQSHAVPLAASLAARDLGERTPFGRRGAQA